MLVLLFVSCGSYPKKNGFSIGTEKRISNPYFADSLQDYIYKANIEAFGNSFGGIFIVKKLGSDHHRIAFTTEMGNKIFDFSFQGDVFTVNHILKEMDKKILINILKNDFQVLIKEHPFVEKNYVLNNQNIFKTQVGTKKYYYFLSEERLEKVVRVSNGKEKVELLFSEINDVNIGVVEILHKNIKLKIKLRALSSQ